MPPFDCLEAFRFTRWRLSLALAAALLLPVLLLPGCDVPPQDVFEPYRPRPKATPAYLIYYGPPPVVDNPHVEALVGYLPTQTDPRLLAPLPLFMAAASGHTQHLLQRLIDFDHEMARAMGLLNPFPAGSRIQAYRRHHDTVALDLSHHARRQTDPSLLQAMSHSLIQTMLQFPGVRTVSVTVDGHPLAHGNHLAALQEIVGPGRPKLLGVFNAPDDGRPVWTFYFDRPVKVEAMRLLNEDGTPIRGVSSYIEYGMGFVLRPEIPDALQDGERIRVSWQAVDALETRGAGEATIFLR